MSLIKDIYSASFFERFTGILRQTIPSFDQKKFISLIFDGNFENREWKERMKHTTRVFHECLPADFSKAVKLIEKVIAKLREEKFGEDGLAFIFFADYIETYGLDNFDDSVKALESITQFVSCEFAVRPFILKYGDKMIAEMMKWSLHENYKVRRLASEGSRPRLPWAMAIPELKKNPAPILPLLENLKNDPSEWVRRSVANSLNDIARDHADIVLQLARNWQGTSKETDALIKHGCRTLLKQGHAEILKHYGLESENIILTDFIIKTPVVETGNSLEFGFTVTNTGPGPQVVRLEYGIYYNKANGRLARKVFKISERIYESGRKENVQRKQSFRLITTRTFYPGLHQLSIILNGEEKERQTFSLV